MAWGRHPSLGMRRYIPCFFKRILQGVKVTQIWIQNLLKRGMLYLKWTINFGIKYTDSFDVELTGYPNLDWASNLDDKRSTTGYAFSIGSKIVSWSSKKQPTVSFSSTEAEYKAWCVATCKVFWLRRILHDVGEEQKNATVIKCDNQSSIKLENNPIFMQGQSMLILSSILLERRYNLNIFSWIL